MRTSRVRPTTRGMLRSTIVAVAVVIAVAAVSVKLLQPDLGTPQRSVHPAQLPATPAGDAEAITKVPNARKASMETFEVFVSRDPFEPLVEDSTAATGETAAAPVDGDHGAVESQPKKDASATPPADANEPEEKSSARDSAAASSRGSGRLSVRLVAVRRGREAVVRIDRTLHHPGKGQRFADNFELLSVRDDCASILYGDEQFVLCRGQEILK
jgi:hypothetical protein